jgi:pimeloyl-ACP methyl ester carboxylesterase
VIELIDAAGTGVHLVGHSYGGGVALKAASMRPAAVASLSLYEPSAFHILRQLGAAAAPDLAEIEALAASVGTGVVSGAYREAAATFVNYWNGEGAWQALRAEVRDELVRWLPKAPLDFRALLGDDTPIATYRSFACPTLLMRGAHARGPSRRIVNALSNVMMEASIASIDGAGHMGPFSHAEQTHDLIAGHIAQAIRRSQQGEGQAPQAA